ncbi:MAG: hypothetical protein ACYC3Q_00870 [Gemmatimonadaceae bacterium]
MPRSLLHAVAAMSSAAAYHECHCGTPRATPDAQADRPADFSERRGGTPCARHSLADLYAEGLPYDAISAADVVPPHAGTVFRREGIARWHVLAVLTPVAWRDSATAARLAAFERSHPAVDFRVVTPGQANHLLSRRRMNPADPAPLFMVLNAAFEEVCGWTDAAHRGDSWSWLPCGPATGTQTPFAREFAGDPVIVLEHLAA